MDTQTFVDSLQAQAQPIEPTDAMAEAGRKALLNDLIKMLQHEAGSRTGEDPEEVHDMRVSTRRMRSTLRLLASYYKPKAIQPYLKDLRRLAHLLGEVRDLDVMIGDLTAYQQSLDAEQSAAFQPVIDALNEQRTKARQDLIRRLDKGGYERFVNDFSAFVTTAGKGAYPVDVEDIRPFQVRHLLPELIYQHLSAVRAYDSALDNADLDTLHALRIEFKRLRYAVSIFSDVLGGSGSSFIDGLKAIQDHLGRIIDIRVAKDRLTELTEQFDPDQQAATVAALEVYLQQMDEQQSSLRAGFGEVWKHFNTRTVQRQLANALAGL